MTQAIVYTRPGGGVDVCYPSSECLEAMSCGGLWDDRPRGYLDEQIERQVAAGIHRWAAERFARAVQFGGCSQAEAFAIIRDRDCGHMGTGHEIWDLADVPKDRWFRDAWRRSHNGGPIGVDMAAARKIQLTRIGEAAKRGKAGLQLARWRERMRQAETPDQLRQVWPRGLAWH